MGTEWAEGPGWVEVKQKMSSQFVTTGNSFAKLRSAIDTARKRKFSVIELLSIMASMPIDSGWVVAIFYNERRCGPNPKRYKKKATAFYGYAYSPVLFWGFCTLPLGHLQFCLSLGHFFNHLLIHLIHQVGIILIELKTSLKLLFGDVMQIV